MRKLFGGLGIAVLLCAGIASLQAAKEEDKGRDWGKNKYEKSQGFVVHEWGVICQSYTAQGLQESKIPNEFPEFVKDITAKIPKQDIKPGGATARKPIIYFYGDNGETFDVAITVNAGSPLLAWPESEIKLSSEVETTPVKSTVSDEKEELGAVGRNAIRDERVDNLRRAWMPYAFVWKGVKLENVGEGKCERVGEKSWFKEARDVQAPGIDFGGVKEKFLFYEAKMNQGAAGWFQAAKKDGQISISHWGQNSMHDVFILSVKDGEISLDYKDTVKSLNNAVQKRGAGAQPEGVSFKPALLEDKDHVKACEKKLTEILEKAGLYAAEAEGMVKIWSESFFKRDGVRIIYRLDPKDYDNILPLSLSKKPDSLKRVMLVCVDLELLK